jgi:hypothetical protein
MVGGNHQDVLFIAGDNPGSVVFQIVSRHGCTFQRNGGCCCFHVNRIVGFWNCSFHGVRLVFLILLAIRIRGGGHNVTFRTALTMPITGHCILQQEIGMVNATISTGRNSDDTIGSMRCCHADGPPSAHRRQQQSYYEQPWPYESVVGVEGHGGEVLGGGAFACACKSFER